MSKLTNIIKNTIRILPIIPSLYFSPIISSLYFSPLKGEQQTLTINTPNQAREDINATVQINTIDGGTNTYNIVIPPDTESLDLLVDDEVAVTDNQITPSYKSTVSIYPNPYNTNTKSNPTIEIKSGTTASDITKKFTIINNNQETKFNINDDQKSNNILSIYNIKGELIDNNKDGNLILQKNSPTGIYILKAKVTPYNAISGNKNEQNKNGNKNEQNENELEKQRDPLSGTIITSGEPNASSSVTTFVCDATNTVTLQLENAKTIPLNCYTREQETNFGIVDSVFVLTKNPETGTFNYFIVPNGSTIKVCNEEQSETYIFPTKPGNSLEERINTEYFAINAHNGGEILNSEWNGNEHHYKVNPASYSGNHHFEKRSRYIDEDYTFEKLALFLALENGCFGPPTLHPNTQYIIVSENHYTTGEPLLTLEYMQGLFQTLDNIFFSGYTDDDGNRFYDGIFPEKQEWAQQNPVTFEVDENGPRFILPEGYPLNNLIYAHTEQELEDLLDANPYHYVIYIEDTSNGGCGVSYITDPETGFIHVLGNAFLTRTHQNGTAIQELLSAIANPNSIVHSLLFGTSIYCNASGPDIPNHQSDIMLAYYSFFYSNYNNSEGQGYPQGYTLYHILNKSSIEGEPGNYILHIKTPKKYNPGIQNMDWYETYIPFNQMTSNSEILTNRNNKK